MANLALASLTLAAVAGLSRLFSNPAHFFWPVAATATAVHVVTWAARRAQLPLVAAAALAVVAAAVCSAWVVLGSTTAFGIPWHGTLTAARRALSDAAEVYRTSSVPAPAVPGFVLAGSFGAASAAFLSDWAAFRMRATTEACLPSFSLFVLSAALAQGRHVVLAGGLWLAALLAVLLTRQPAVEGSSTAWFASRSRQGPTSVLVAGGVLAAATVAIAAAIGPVLPGASVHPVIDWRHHNTTDNGRNTNSPLVDIRARLHNPSGQEVFTVTSPRAVYWRLTSLDTFDGFGWSLNDTYSRSGAASPCTASLGSDANAVAPPEDGPTTPLRVDVKVSALESIWLPTPYRPCRVSPASGVSYSAGAASLITSKATSDGLAYTVTAAVPAATPAMLDALPFVSPDDPALGRYLRVPTTVSPRVTALALQITARATTPYGKARAIQDYLRGPAFRYSLDVPADDTPRALDDFLLITKAGFCQQFAGAFGAMARIAGLPTRIAVGFTPGQLEADGRYHVRDEHAHAWPEVYFAGVGWIAFEPTPGRGSPDPGAQSVTGAPPAQAGDATNSASTTPSAPTTAAPAAPSAATPTVPRGELGGAANGSDATVHHHRSLRQQALRWGAVLGLAGGGLAVIWLAGLAVAAGVVRRLRRRRATSPAEQVSLAWAEAGEAMATHGLPRRAAETPAEFAHRMDTSPLLPRRAADAIGELRTAVELAAYAPGGSDPESAAAAGTALTRLQAALGAHRVWWRRAAGRFDPRPLHRALSALRRTRRDGPPRASAPPSAPEISLRA